MTMCSNALPQHENLRPKRSTTILAALLYSTVPNELADGYKWIPPIASASWR